MSLEQEYQFLYNWFDVTNLDQTSSAALQTLIFLSRILCFLTVIRPLSTEAGNWFSRSSFTSLHRSRFRLHTLPSLRAGKDTIGRGVEMRRYRIVGRVHGVYPNHLIVRAGLYLLRSTLSDANGRRSLRRCHKKRDRVIGEEDIEEG